MKRLYVQTIGPCQWRELLVDPKKHWKRGRSAFELAISWERAQSATNDSGIPPEVAAVLDTAPALSGAKLLFGFPEHQITLNNEKAPSQTDLWALLRNDHGLISLGIEAKAGEPFDATVQDWLEKDQKRKGREERLAWLCGELGGSPSMESCGRLRYQLFHRTVSALKAARRCHGFAAVMLVQSFSEDTNAWRDFEQFGSYLGSVVEKERLVPVLAGPGPQLYLGWVSSKSANDNQIAAAVALAPGATPILSPR
jgi:hypothetical protein